MEAKSSTQMVRFLTKVCQLHSRLEFFLKTLKCSAGHVECSFDNPTEKFLSKSRKLLAQRPKMIKELYFFQKKICFFNEFLWTCRLQFRRP